MLERLFNLIDWIDAAFTRTRDPLLAEYRNVQKQVIISSALAMMGMVLAFLVMPSSESETGFLALAQIVETYAALAFLLVSAVATAWLIWATYRLWRFSED